MVSIDKVTRGAGSGQGGYSRTLLRKHGHHKAKGVAQSVDFTSYKSYMAQN